MQMDLFPEEREGADSPPPDSNEWYTPSEYIEAARRVMGSIDLDPASCALAQQTVQAKTFYTKEQNGLILPWEGNVWMNPPYSRDLLAPFAEKIIHSVHDGSVNQSIVLVNNCTETQWGQDLIRCGISVCFPSSRIRFYGPHRDEHGPRRGQMLIYLRKHWRQRHTDLFRDVFSPFGLVLRM